MHQHYSAFVCVRLVALLTLLLVGCGPGQEQTMTSPSQPTGLQWLLSLLTPAPKNTVASLEATAQQLLARGEATRAEQHAQQALRILEDAWGAEHPEVASALEYLVDIYSAQSKYVEAEPLLQNALAIREKTFGNEHPEVAANLERYAALLRQLQRDTEAQSLAARAQTIRARVTQAQRPPG